MQNTNIQIPSKLNFIDPAEDLTILAFSCAVLQCKATSGCSIDDVAALQKMQGAILCEISSQDEDASSITKQEANSFIEAFGKALNGEACEGHFKNLFSSIAAYCKIADKKAYIKDALYGIEQFQGHIVNLSDDQKIVKKLQCLVM